jgi:hypothetical protein
MDKGIIIGAEHESSMVATLPFVTFRHATSVRQWLAISGEHSLTDVIVALVLAPHLTLSFGSWPSTRGGLLRVALPTPGFLRPRSRDSPPHGRRIRSSWRGCDDSERRRQYPSVCHRVFRLLRCCSRCGSGLCAQDRNGALAPTFRYRG